MPNLCPLSSLRSDILRSWILGLLRRLSMSLACILPYLQASSLIGIDLRSVSISGSNCALHAAHLIQSPPVVSRPCSPRLLQSFLSCSIPLSWPKSLYYSLCSTLGCSYCNISTARSDQIPRSLRTRCTCVRMKALVSKPGCHAAASCSVLRPGSHLITAFSPL